MGLDFSISIYAHLFYQFNDENALKRAPIRTNAHTRARRAAVCAGNSMVARKSGKEKLSVEIYI